MLLRSSAPFRLSHHVHLTASYPWCSNIDTLLLPLNQIKFCRVILGGGYHNNCLQTKGLSACHQITDYIIVVTAPLAKIYRFDRHLTINYTVNKFYHTFKFYEIFFFLVVGFALRNLCSLGKYSTTWTTPQPFLLLVNFWIGFGFFVGGLGNWVWTLGFALAKQVLYVLVHTSSPFDLVILEMKSHELFALAGLEPWSSLQAL
jgi:hypothetical protein